MNSKIILSATALILALLIVGCGDDDDNGVSPVTGPSAPANLVTSGTYGNIQLNWDASSGGGLSGYYIYRGTDGTIFAKFDSTTIELEYDDMDVSDGVVYYYRVTAKGDAESGPSNTVRDIHGTRLSPTYAAGLIVAAGLLNPYVVEDTVVINGGNLVIQDGAELYVKDGAVLDIEYIDINNRYFHVYGLLRVLATADSNATFTCHKTGGNLTTNEGFCLQFHDNAVDYDTLTDDGCLIQNTLINNLHYSNNAVYVGDCSPKFYNCKISANIITGGSYFEISGSAAPIIENCSINNIVLTIKTDFRGTQASIKKNICRDGYYTLYFSAQSNPAVTLGQIANNDFDGNTDGIYLQAMTGGTNIPLGNNYWLGGTPTVILGPTTSITVDFTPTLASPPADCGPTW